MAETVKELVNGLGKQIAADAKEFAKAELNKVIDAVPEALELAVKETKTPLDDMLVASLKDKLVEILKAEVAKI